MSAQSTVPTVEQLTESFTAYATRAQEATEVTVRAVTEAVETTVTASFDVAQRVLDGQRAVVTALLQKH